MEQDYLLAIFNKNIEQLYKEIEAYNKEENLWIVDGAVSNSAGTLCLHLIGNLNHFIGAKLGNTGFVRDRDAEFSTSNVPKATLLKEIKSIEALLPKVFNSFNDTRFKETFDGEGFFEGKTVGFVLMYISSHLSYHLGQINYHRRLLDK